MSVLFKTTIIAMLMAVLKLISFVFSVGVAYWNPTMSVWLTDIGEAGDDIFKSSLGNGPVSALLQRADVGDEIVTTIILICFLLILLIIWEACKAMFRVSKRDNARIPTE